jgi:predicted nucleic acid-binding protein
MCAPGAVISELTAASTPELVRSVIESRPAWLTVRDPGGDALSRIRADLDAGERAALALALEMDADLVLIDDAAGRREAVSLGIKVTGTIGVLRLAAERGLIDVQGVLARLRSAGFYIHDDVIRAAFEIWL